jgi:hypothetical protein
MLAITYPEPSFRMKKENDREMLFDPIRKKWLLITPEEWVRQNFIQYLILVKNYPAAFIALEKEIVLGELKKRFDILIYDQSHNPWMIIECKSTDVSLSASTLQQALRYNISVPVEYILITNGHYTNGWRKSGGSLSELKEIPAWDNSSRPS